tara:strand:- start:881 stop:1204 length:324 start_codon:yes stop_codon:yes gene_type:complete
MGDSSRYNPEDLFMSSLSACHMLWYLHLCATKNIIVTSYIDDAIGIMEEDESGSGKFTEVTLNPIIKITDASRIDEAISLHEEANRLCFIANSCNFKIKHNPTVSES